MKKLWVVAIIFILGMTTFTYSQQIKNSITVTDGAGGSQVLEFGLDPTALDGFDAFESVAPPFPVGGVFQAQLMLGNDGTWIDIRTGSNNSFTTKEHIIKYQVGAGTTITISWNLPAGITGRLQDIITGTLIDKAMAGNDSYTVTNPAGFSRLKMSIYYLLGDLPTPVLKSPANNSTEQAISANLVWYKAQYAEVYKLQVATDVNFTNIVFSDSTLSDTTKVVGPLNPVTKYYWRVQSKSTKTAKPNSAFSSVWNFTTDLIIPNVPGLITPVNGAINIPLSTKLFWHKADYASSYEIYLDGGWTHREATTIDTTSDFSFLKGNAVHTWKIRSVNGKGKSNYSNEYTFTTIAVTWSTMISFASSNVNLNQGTLVRLGFADNATDGIDNIYGESTLPPKPIAGISDVRFILANNEASTVDFRKDDKDSQEWILEFQPNSSGYPVKFRWSLENNIVGTLLLKDRIGGSIINIDMKTQDSIIISNSGITSLIIEYKKLVTVNKDLKAGWNMVSVPVNVPSMNAIDLFPDANSKVFGFNGGYIDAANLQNGKGYWVRYANAKIVPFTGQFVNGNRISVNAGWNMIGCFDKEVNTTQITSDPQNIINSSFFEFDNSYRIAASLKPGAGYWVRVNQNGELIFPSNLSKTKDRAEFCTDANWKTISVTDYNNNKALLYLADQQNFVNIDLPPSPPTGVFDARWSSSKLIESSKTNNEILIKSASYPIRITATGMNVIVKDKLTGKIINQFLKNGETMTITDESIEVLEVISEEMPSEFELFHNYPNPFNPTTTIKYALPSGGLVKLGIFNALGEEIETLVDEIKEAGYHEVIWNAQKVSSGVYFYRISTEQYQSIKKMILIK